MKKLNLRYPLILICMAATASLSAGCDLDDALGDTCGNGQKDIAECDNPDSPEYCPADCDPEVPAGEGEGEPPVTGGEGEGEGEAPMGCTEGDTQCSEDNTGLQTCNADGTWADAVACDAGKHCISGENVAAQCDWVRDSYRWIRVCSTTTKSEVAPRPVGTRPGPDIDAIEVFDSEDNLKGAVTQSGTSEIQDEDNVAQDVTEALGPPDATGTGDAAGCGGFTAIGLKGHFLVVGTEFDIVPGDKVVVHEVPNCDLDENDLRIESSQLDLSVLSADGLWFELAATHQGGQGTYTVQPDAGVTESAECQPCEAGDADCEP